MKVVEFKFLTLDNRSDSKYEAWSRMYEYPYMLDTLAKLGANETSQIHNTSWGFEGVHVVFKNDMDIIYPLTMHSDILYSSLPNTYIYDITTPICQEFHDKFDFVLNISTVEEVGASNTLILRNLFQQVKPGGYLIITFDYKDGYSQSIRLQEVEEFIGKKIDTMPNNALTYLHSNPNIPYGLQCGVLILQKD